MINWFLENLTLLLLVGLSVLMALFIWLLRDPQSGIPLTFFATGFLISPNLPVVREKFSAGEAIMTLTWVAFFLTRRIRGKKLQLTNLQKNSVIFGIWFISWTFLSFLVNSLIYPETILNGPGSIVETCNFIYGYCMFITVVFVVDDWRRWRACVNGWLWGSVFVSAFGVWGLSGHGPTWTYDEFTGRVCSTLRTENQVPSFLLPIFVLLVFAMVEIGRSIRDRWALTFLAVGVFLTSIGTGSRTAFLMMIAAGFGILYVASRESKYKTFNSGRLARNFLLVCVGFVFYVSAALANYQGDYQLGRTPGWKRPAQMFYEWIHGKGNLDVNREAQLEFVSKNIGNHLLIGTGPKNYGQIYGVEEIHNTYAGVLFQMGVPGLVLFLLWLWAVLRAGWRASRKIEDPHRRLVVLCMLVGMILLMLYSLTMFGLRQRNIWLLAGLLVAADRFVPRSSAAARFCRARPGTAVGGKI